ncbi:MAG: glycosyltransferase family 1 protein [Marinilabiliaceae bacterium]|nr:glycosyltransferase family 1 protein [Marinilabiliaceae bacterium]
MRVLSVGSFSRLSNTCLHRTWALKSIADHVDEVNTTSCPATLWYRIAYHLFLWGLPVPIPQNNSENDVIKRLVDENAYDIVWIDKGNSIAPETIRYIRTKQPSAKIVSYSPDNMALRHNQSQQFVESIPLYDLHVTTKSYIIDDLKRLGAKQVMFVNKSYAKEFHYPREVDEADYERLGEDVGFIGAWEEERCRSMIYLATHGIRVRVWGGGKWNDYRDVSPNLRIEGRYLFDEDYSKALRLFKISLCFLRKMNYDQQTSRTMEIPASGGFMLAERTSEHQSLFREGEEAEFFSSDEELLEKCRYYLATPAERERIAQAGTRRCLESDYSNEGMVRRVLRELGFEKF